MVSLRGPPPFLELENHQPEQESYERAGGLNASLTLVYCKITVDDKMDTIRGSVMLFDWAGNTWLPVDAR